MIHVLHCTGICAAAWVECDWSVSQVVTYKVVVVCYEQLVSHFCLKDSRPTQMWCVHAMMGVEYLSVS